MANQSESGHAKNVANLGALITVVVGFGEVYNPSKTALTVAALATLNDRAKGVMHEMNGLEGAYNLAVDHRELAFAPLGKLSTRILNAIRSSDVAPQIVETVESLVRKLTGQRATPRLTEEEKAALVAEGTVVKEVSSSQMSYDNRLDSLDKLVQLLPNIPQYAPNEEELKVTTLVSLKETLSASNDAAIQAGTALGNIRRVRNEVLYSPGTGVIDIAKAVKAYVKSLFGATSLQYKQLSALTFKDRG